MGRDQAQIHLVGPGAVPDFDVAPFGKLQPDDLRHPGAGVVEHAQEQMIALADPGGARRADDGHHLVSGQEAEHWSLEALHRHAQRLLQVLA